MRRTTYVSSGLVIAIVFGMALMTLTVSADEGAEPTLAEPDEAEAIRVLTDEEAGALIKQIKTLGRKREAAPLLAVLTPEEPGTHEDLPKVLLPLLKHADIRVALAAGSLLQVQRIEKDREREKVAKAVWKTGWSSRTNAKRYGVRGRALRAHAALKGGVIDAGPYGEVRGVWQKLIGDPKRPLAPGMVEICRYVRESKDKRFCRLLAEEIDLPQPTDINSPTNPPGEWWQRRYEMWREYNAEAVEALEVVTGQTFKTTKDAQEWFQAHETRFGFRW